MWFKIVPIKSYPFLKIVLNISRKNISNTDLDSKNKKTKNYRKQKKRDNSWLQSITASFPNTVEYTEQWQQNILLYPSTFGTDHHTHFLFHSKMTAH